LVEIIEQIGIRIRHNRNLKNNQLYVLLSEIQRCILKKNKSEYKLSQYHSNPETEVPSKKLPTKSNLKNAA
jgi:hypothetical protein